MTALLSILKLSWPYLLCAIVAGYLTHRWDLTAYDRLQTSFSSYKTQVAEEGERAQQAVTAALQTQIQTRLKTEANNGKVIQELQAQRDSAVADAQLARRLLLAAQIDAHGRAVPKATDRQPAPAAGPASGGGSLTQELAAAISECRSNADQLDALIAELRPQL